MVRVAPIRLLLSGLIDGALWVVPPLVTSKLLLDPLSRHRARTATAVDVVLGTPAVVARIQSGR
jgi:hypothetical protein